MVDSYSHMKVTTEKDTQNKSPLVEAMFKVGAHYGFIKSRRHPTVKPFIFGVKNRVEIFDLEKTSAQLEAAIDFVKKVAASGKQVVFIGSKSEARQAVKEAADRIAQPYVAGRWIGGTFTNFEVIRKRVEKLLDLTSKKEKNELTKYTKKERLMIDREIEKLNDLFGGITSMNHLPGAIFIVDPKKEHIAVAEAIHRNIPIVALSGADCDVSNITYPVVANDASIDSVAFISDKISAAYAEGKKMAVAEKAASTTAAVRS
ncbi:MAG: small subunit ribosomal protein [Patescibacteria group bacterium]|nr:small subunit ribosomal protein [Patescibacteria group bacterium]